MEKKEMRIGQKVGEKLFTLYLNKNDDYVLINVNDAGIFDRYAEFLEWIDRRTIDYTDREKELQQKYENGIIAHDEDGEVVDVNTGAFVEAAKLRSGLFRETEARLDKIFGKNTCKKYFRALYEANPDFVPDDECLYDFLEEITPVMNNLFADRRKRIELKYSRERKGGRGNKYRTKEQLLADYRK